MLKFGDNDNHTHSDRCQPPTDRRIARATQGSLPGKGHRMTKIQAQLYGMQSQQGVLFRDLLVVKNRLGLNQEAWFLPLDYTGNSIAVAERQILQKKWAGNRVGS